MKKSINLWAFPIPSGCRSKNVLRLAKDAGFDGIELNYDLDNDLSPKSSSEHLRSIRKAPSKSELPSADSARFFTGRIPSPITIRLAASAVWSWPD